MEVPTLLFTVQRIVRGIEIEFDAHWRLTVGRHEDVDGQSRDGACVVVELVVPIQPNLARVLQPVERRLARELAARRR